MKPAFLSVRLLISMRKASPQAGLESRGRVAVVTS